MGESKGGMNRIHGTLLTARFVLERKADLGVELASGRFPMLFWVAMARLTLDYLRFGVC